LKSIGELRKVFYLFAHVSIHVDALFGRFSPISVRVLTIWASAALYRKDVVQTWQEKKGKKEEHKFLEDLTHSRQPSR